MSARLKARSETYRLAAFPDPAAWLATRGSGIDHVPTDGARGIDAETLAALPNLKAIGSYGVGYDAGDIASATARGIPVSHTPSVLDPEVATTALMLMLAAFRNFEAQAAHARNGRWARDGALPLSRTADSETVGILGPGRIGKAFANKLAPFQPKILYSGRGKQDVPYDYVPDPVEMAKAADVLVSIVPAGAATQRPISVEAKVVLGPDGILINVGRGSTVDEPKIPEALRTLPNVVPTPHMGGATVETRAAMGNLAIDNLFEHLDTGKPIAPVPESKAL